MEFRKLIWNKAGKNQGILFQKNAGNPGKAQKPRKAYFDLLCGIDQCVVYSGNYGTLL